MRHLKYNPSCTRTLCGLFPLRSARHTYCAQDAKDWGITVSRRKGAVSLIPFPNAKKPITWIKPMRAQLIVACLLCWQNETSKASGIKIHCSTHTEGTPRKQTLSYVLQEKKEPFHATRRNSFLLCSIMHQKPCSQSGVGAIFCILAFCLLLWLPLMGCMPFSLCTQKYYKI